VDDGKGHEVVFVETAALAEALRSAKEVAERAEAGIQATALKLNDSLKHKAAQVLMTLVVVFFVRFFC